MKVITIKSESKKTTKTDKCILKNLLYVNAITENNYKVCICNTEVI